MVDSVNDTLLRFKIWANNIGAFAKGPTSLDWRLRGHPEICSDIARILHGFTDCLQILLSLTTGDRQPEMLESSSELDYLSIEDGVANEDDLELDPDLPDNETDGMLAEVSESVTRLLRYSIAIRKIVSRDPFAKALSKSARWADTYDTEHLLHSVPKLANSEWLAKRLGRAMTQRRQFFSYRQSHQDAINASASDEAKSVYTTASTMAAPPRFSNHNASNAGGLRFH